MKIRKVALVEMKSIDRLNIYALVKMSRGITLLAAILLEQSDCTVDCYVETIQSFDWQCLANYDLIGFGIITCTAKPTYDVIRRLRSTGYSGKIVVGGPHATECPEESLAAGANVVVRHEGDKTLPQLISALENDENLEGVLGLTWMKNGNICSSPDQSLLTEEELSRLPLPSFKSIIGYEKLRQISLVFSRGCPYLCVFCAVKSMFGAGYRFASVDWRIQQLKTLRDEYPDLWEKCIVFFGDDNFFGTPRGRKIAILMLERIISENLILPKGWMNQMRVSDADPDTSALMKLAGDITSCLGIESTDAKTLRALNKGQTPEDIRVGLKNLHDQGINTLAMVIAGADTSTFWSFFRDIRQLWRWGITYLQIVAMVPLPGTKMTSDLKTKGRKFSLDYNQYNGMHALIKPARMTKFGVWMSLYLVSAWFYFLTSHGRSLLIKYPRAFCKMVTITILQGLKWPWQY